MNNKLLPMACGLLFGILFVILFCLYTRKSNVDKLQYDERQEHARGIAFKYGFFTLLVLSALLMIVSAGKFALPISYSLLQCIGIVISIAVFATISIVNDAYFSLNESKIRVQICFAVIAIVNGAIAMIAFMRAGEIDTIDLTSGFMNLICTVLFAYLFIVMLVHQLFHEKDDEEADDEEP